MPVPNHGPTWEHAGTMPLQICSLQEAEPPEKNAEEQAQARIQAETLHIHISPHLPTLCSSQHPSDNMW